MVTCRAAGAILLDAVCSICHSRDVSTDERLDRLTGIAESLAARVAARDDEIEAHTRQIGALIELAAQWQAYIRGLPRN
jgi:hypothetical protein